MIKHTDMSQDGIKSPLKAYWAIKTAGHASVQDPIAIQKIGLLKKHYDPLSKQANAAIGKS